MRCRLGHIAVVMTLVAGASFVSTDARASRFCDDCDTFTTMPVQTGQVRTIPYRTRLGAVLSQKVIVRPRGGIYGTANETAGAYKANNGFVDNDSFQVDIEYEKSGQRFETHLKATVNVHP
jgi:hypothetical protein